MDGRVGDDRAHEGLRDSLHPVHLVECFLVAAVGLDEDGADELVAACVDVLEHEATAERRRLVEPVVATLRRVPEVEVRVEELGHQRTTRAAPPRIT